VVLAKKTRLPPRRIPVQAHSTNMWKLAPLYMPSSPVKNPFGDLIASNDPYQFAQSYAYNWLRSTITRRFFLHA